MACVIHNNEGRIVQTIEGEVEEGFARRVEESGLRLLQVELKTILGVNIGSLYVETNERVICERPTASVTLAKRQILADDLDEAIITGLPDPCVLTIDDVDHEIAGGSLIITSPMPATYRLTCRHWPYLDWEATLEAVAA